MQGNTSPWSGLSASSPLSAEEPGPWVLAVVGAEHRVGASLTALALAEAARSAGLAVVLVDAAPPRWSGLRPGLEVEGPHVALGSPVTVGERGGMPVRVLDAHTETAPPEAFLHGITADLVVVDAGLPLSESPASPWAEVADTWILATAVTHLGLWRAEAALTALSRSASEPRGLTGMATSLDPLPVAGELVRRAGAQVWCAMPLDSAVAVEGAALGALPPALIWSGRDLLRRVAPLDLAGRIPARSPRGYRKRGHRSSKST